MQATSRAALWLLLLAVWVVGARCMDSDDDYSKVPPCFPLRFSLDVSIEDCFQKPVPASPSEIFDELHGVLRQWAGNSEPMKLDRGLLEEEGFYYVARELANLPISPVTLPDCDFHAAAIDPTTDEPDSKHVSGPIWKGDLICPMHEEGLVKFELEMEFAVPVRSKYKESVRMNWSLTARDSTAILCFTKRNRALDQILRMWLPALDEAAPMYGLCLSGGNRFGRSRQSVWSLTHIQDEALDVLSSFVKQHVAQLNRDYVVDPDLRITCSQSTRQLFWPIAKAELGLQKLHHDQVSQELILDPEETMFFALTTPSSPVMLSKAMDGTPVLSYRNGCPIGLELHPESGHCFRTIFDCELIFFNIGLKMIQIKVACEDTI